MVLHINSSRVRNLRYFPHKAHSRIVSFAWASLGIAFIIPLFPMHETPLLSQVVTGNVPAVSPLKQNCLPSESTGEAMAWSMPLSTAKM